LNNPANILSFQNDCRYKNKEWIIKTDHVNYLFVETDFFFLFKVVFTLHISYIPVYDNLMLYAFGLYYLHLKRHAAFLEVSINQPVIKMEIHIEVFFSGCLDKNKI
jgi:hypothetical protein